MSHIDAIFDNASDAATRRRMQQQRENPLPLLGRAWLPAGMVDMQLLRKSPDLATYGPAHHSSHPETVSVFIFNALFDFPNWHRKGDTSDAAVDKIRFIKETMHKDKAELRKRGCDTACLLENQFKSDDNPLWILQYGIYVPNTRYHPTENGHWFEPNTKDQVIFLKYLFEKGYVDPDIDREMIIDAFNARVLHLVQTKQKLNPGAKR